MRSLSLRKWFAAVLSACMVMTNIMPSFAEPAWEMPEASEDILTAEAGGITEVEEVAEVSVTEEDLNAERAEEQNAAKLLGADPDRVTVTYIDENGDEQSADCILMSGTEAVDSYTFAEGEWYVVQGTFVVTGHIVNDAPEGKPAHLILYSGCELQARKGIENTEGKELIIYAHNAAEYDSSVLTTYYKNESGTEVSEIDYRNAGIGGTDSIGSGKLTINGGKIRVMGGDRGAGIGGGTDSSREIIINDGIIIAAGGDSGAGIGGGSRHSAPAVTINGGTVTATGGDSGAGIGGGYSGSSATVTINGGTVTATGGDSGAGIGGGYLGSAATVTINGGTVTATGGDSGAGIGGGYYGVAGTVTVNGGEVTAQGGENSAGIGGGYHGSAGTVTITGGTVTATGGGYAAGIGGGTITVTGGTVKATGGIKSAGIGNGFSCSGVSEIVITGGEVTATGGDSGAGIGGGFNDPGAMVSINGGTVTASGGDNGAGIGGGYLGSSGTVTINGGTVTAQGGNNGAGIGSGSSGTSETVTINDGTVTAQGGSNGAGIGGGSEGSGGKVTISGGTVTVYGQGKAAGIGGGAEVESKGGNGSDLEISGGTVEVFGGSEGVGIGGGKGCESQGTAVVDETIFRILAGSSREDAVKQSLEDYLKDRAHYVRLESLRKYTVAHSLQKADGSGCDIQEEEIFYGLPGSMTKASAKTYTGFEVESFEQQAVADDDSTVVVIKYDREIYTIEFDANGHGTAPESITALYGAAVTEPEAPEDPDHFFGGWYKDKECTEIFVFTVMPLNGAKIYAKWTPTFWITWMDGETVLRKDRVETGTLPEYGVNPAKTGFAFTGWDRAPEIVSKDAVYTATFCRTIEGYRVVNFDSKGGTSVSAAVVEDGNTVAKPSDPVKEGYTFEGWFADESLGTEFDFTKAILADTIVYAKWSEIAKPQYTVTWKTDTGEVIDTTPVTEGEMPAHADAEKEGYVFIGWNPALSPVKADVTYTAKFIEKTKEQAAVKFDTNGGTFIDTQIVIKGQTAARPEDPEKSGYVFEGWYADESLSTAFDFAKAVYEDTVVYAKWKQESGKTYTILWKDYDGKELAAAAVAEGGLPKYPYAKPVRSGYIFTGWTPEIDLATADKTYTATYVKTSSGGGGGGSSVILGKQTGPTFSPNWYSDELGVWRIRNSAGETVVNAWLCDDFIKANGKNVWYLLRQDGAMLAVGLVQDNTGNYYSLETEHNGYFGMLRYEDGYYNCGGQTVYLTFNREHNGAFGAVTNADGLEKLKAIYGVKRYEIGNENAVYTASF